MREWRLQREHELLLGAGGKVVWLGCCGDRGSRQVNDGLHLTGHKGVAVSFKDSIATNLCIQGKFTGLIRLITANTYRVS
jgi:hypothetical protein